MARALSPGITSESSVTEDITQLEARALSDSLTTFMDRIATNCRVFKYALDSDCCRNSAVNEITKEV